MKYAILTLILLLIAGPVWAETVTGVLDGVNPTENQIVVNGVAYEVNLEDITIYYNNERISWQDLQPGDGLSLMLSDEASTSVQREVEEIIVIRGQLNRAGD